MTSPQDARATMSDRGFISWTQLSTYRQCPLRYYFRYVERLPEPFVSASLLFGGAFHRAVELYHRQVFEDAGPPSLDEMLGAFWEEWRLRAETTDEIKFNKGDDLTSCASLADRMLRAFLDSSVAGTEGTVVGIEEELKGAVIPGCPDLLARVDLVIDQGHDLIVRDYKTARSRWSQKTAEDSAEQLLLYSLLTRELIPEKQLRLEFALVTKTKVPAVELYEIKFDQARVKRTKRIAKLIYESMSQGIVYPNPSPMNCGGCPFQKPCAAWSG